MRLTWKEEDEVEGGIDAFKYRGEREEASECHNGGKIYHCRSRRSASAMCQRWSVSALLCQRCVSAGEVVVDTAFTLTMTPLIQNVHTEPSGGSSTPRESPWVYNRGCNKAEKAKPKEDAKKTENPLSRKRKDIPAKKRNRSIHIL